MPLTLDMPNAGQRARGRKARGNCRELEGGCDERRK
jgi:hypothetical protein